MILYVVFRQGEGLSEYLDPVVVGFIGARARARIRTVRRMLLVMIPRTTQVDGHGSWMVVGWMQQQQQQQHCSLPLVEAKSDFSLSLSLSLFFTLTQSPLPQQQQRVSIDVRGLQRRSTVYVCIPPCVRSMCFTTPPFVPWTDETVPPRVIVSFVTLQRFLIFLVDFIEVHCVFKTLSSL